MTVDEILRSKGHAVVTIGPDARLSEAVSLLDRHRIGAIVVTGDGHRVIGLLGEQDVVRADHRMTPDELVRAGEEVESRVLARAVRWHCESRILLNGSRTVVFS